MEFVSCFFVSLLGLGVWRFFFPFQLNQVILLLRCDLLLVKFPTDPSISLTSSEDKSVKCGWGQYRSNEISN